MESELEDNEYSDDEHETSSKEEDAFTMAFMDSDFDKLEKLDSYANSPLDSYFPVAKKMNAQLLKLKTKIMSLVLILK